MQERSQGRTQWDPERLKLTSRNRLKIKLTGYTGTLRVEIPFYVLVGKRRELAREHTTTAPDSTSPGARP